MSKSSCINRTYPFDLLVFIERTLKVVDFPAPLGPSKPNTSPFLTQKVLFLIAEKPE
jgi:hypothetical protein